MSAIPHNRPTLGPEEEEAARRVLRSGWVAQGPEVAAFEDEGCRFLGLPDGHAVAVSSGSAALFLALWALDARGKRVAFPAYACAALRHAVAMAGATEALMDCGAATPNVDLAAAGASGADVAIVAHMYGLPADVRALGIPVIEDCAQSLGARIAGASTGTRGDAGVLSFHATKLITSGGQGGMVVSRRRELVEKIRDYRQFDGRTDRKARFNFQLTDLAAAIGRAQLAKLPAFLEARRKIFDEYRSNGLALLDGEGEPVRYRAIVRAADPAALIARLAAAGVTAINPLEEWELLGDPQAFPAARGWCARTVSLPCYPTLEPGAAARIAAITRS